MSKRKILLVPGHCITGDMGAFSSYLGQTEQPYNKSVANILKCRYNEDYDVYEHSIQGYNSRQNELAKFENQRNYKAVVELHFNASAHHTAQGSEVLFFYKSTQGRKYAEIVLDEIVREFGLRNRGVKGISSGNGYGFLSKTKAPAILVEPFFGDEPKCVAFSNIERYAETLHRGFMKF